MPQPSGDSQHSSRGLVVPAVPQTRCVQPFSKSNDPAASRGRSNVAYAATGAHISFDDGVEVGLHCVLSLAGSAVLEILKVFMKAVYRARHE